jgi:hypothetical protein
MTDSLVTPPVLLTSLALAQSCPPPSPCYSPELVEGICLVIIGVTIAVVAVPLLLVLATPTYSSRKSERQGGDSRGPHLATKPGPTPCQWCLRIQAQGQAGPSRRGGVSVRNSRRLSLSTGDVSRVEPLRRRSSRPVCAMLV